MSSEIVKRAQKSFKSDKDAWDKNYKKASEDLSFMSDDEGAQWDSNTYKERIDTKRHCVTIDYLNQFIHQVANDIRQNTPTINVVPSDDKSSQETAEALKGLIKEIEYQSNADDAYDTASLYAVKCGIGFIRVDHEVIPGTEDQRIVIKRVVNPLSCWIDSESIESDGRDAKCGYILDEITVDAFKKRWPDKDPSCFSDDDENSKKERKDEDCINICEYFELEETDSGKIVHRYLLSGVDVLEETTFPGDYIPLVPVYGEECWVNGERQLYSLIRRSKSAQRMRNLWKSIETDLLMNAPLAPISAAVGQVEEFVEDYKNPDKVAVLRYNAKDADGNLIGAPQRIAPPQVPAGIVNASMETVEDIRATMGIYQASLGMQSNETSGIAIRERRIEGDTATYHFGDNLVRSITQVGRILVSAIPVIYSTPRVLKIAGIDEEIEYLGVNGALAQDQEQSIDLLSGKFSVRVQTGASFSTRRQESAQFLLQIIQTDPALMRIFGDLLFKNLDFAGAPVMSERIKKIMEPSVFKDEENPIIGQLTQQLQQAQAIIEALKSEIDTKKAELALKAREEQNDTEEGKARIELDFYKMQVAREESAANLALKEREISIKERELALKEAELQAQTAVNALQGLATLERGQMF